MNTRLLDAAARKPTDRPPVWIMRQAGRYLPQFRAVRAKADFLTVCKTPELACEVTLQPIDILGVDAAIIFSDILIPLEPLGMEVQFLEGKGPYLPTPLRTPQAVQALQRVEPESMEFVAAAIRLTVQALNGRVPLIGFCGSPWTLAAYMIEGGGSKTYSQAKRFMYRYPQAFHALMDKLADALIVSLTLQIDAGASLVQIFDSWGGVLSKADFLTFELPAIQKMIRAVAQTGTPVTFYMNDGAHLLDDLTQTQAQVLGVDWRIDLAAAFERYGKQHAFQGNLDPCLLYAPPEVIKAEVTRMLAQVAGRPGYIANLGHGILPDVPVEGAKAFVEAVQRSGGS